MSTQNEGGSPPPATGEGSPASPPAPPHVLRRTRVGGMWVALAVSAIVLLLLLIFILENGQQANVGFFGAHATLPLGVALLLAAVAGALIVVVPGTGRIAQLRITARRHRRQDTTPEIPPRGDSGQSDPS